MHRRLWLLAGAAVAVLVVATSASATSRTAAVPARTVTPAAAPFAQAWAHVPRTVAGRKAKQVAVVAMEQDLSGTWNTNQADSNLAWAIWAGINPTLRSPYVVTNTLDYVPDLATKVVINHKSITYTIRNDAFWNWGGKKLPVTYKDFVYTWQAIVNPKDNVASRTGLNQISRYTHKGDKQVTFYWKTSHCTQDAPCGPFADYRDLFGYIYPSAALKGMNFNTMWAKCICGSNGKPVSDGPFLLTNYTKGQGATLKANPYWYGAKPGLKEIDFKIITDTNSEIQAIRGGEVDIASPQPQTALSTLRGVKGLTYKVEAGLYLEHVDLQFGPKQSNALMRAPWMRQAIMLGMDRGGLISALYKQIAPGLQPLNSLVYFQSDKAHYKNFFNKWNYNPAKAISILKAHGCTGGPSTPTNGNTNYFTCSGLPAKFSYTTASDNARRVTSETIFKANLAAIGIQIVDNLIPTSVMFGSTVLEAGNYDMMEFAWGGSVDPGGFVAIWDCPNQGGSQNFLGYCNHTVTKLLNATKTQLDANKRAADFIQADQLMANQVPSIPLYALPDVVTYKNSIADVTNNAASGFTWDLEKWHWTS
jgi:ABC-type transport system substrate-binding protein